MPDDVTVPALKPFIYRDKDIARGDLVTMRPADAAAHARRGNVSLARGYKTREKRRYRRRDMEAERG